MAGRYGPYVKWENVNATLPKGADPATITLDEALALVAEKASKGGKGRAGKARAATKAKAAKPAPARKPRAKAAQ
jgi:DNA topoisomerase-1